MITLQDCLDARTIEASFITLLNKLVYNPKCGYVQSHDNKTYWDVGLKPLEIITKLKHQISSGTYKFEPYLRIERRVKQNKLRELYIATWRDKIVDKWLADALNCLLDKWFSRHSYAYRIGNFGIDNCQFMIAKSIRRNGFIIKRDISRFFYTIDHQLLFDQLSKIVDHSDPIWKMLQQRIEFKFDNQIATVGVPFGSPIACVLSNIYLTHLDKLMAELPVDYFRYADDFIILTNDPVIALEAAQRLDAGIAELRLAAKPSHSINMSFESHNGFVKIRKFKHLGLEFINDGTVRLSVDKQRKIMNLFDNALQTVAAKIKRESDINARLLLAIAAINGVIGDRIRSAAIIDYYLKHVTDEAQLKMIDRLIAELVISASLMKPFKKSHFRIIQFNRLRKMGLVSLLHRHRLHKHGHLNVSFMSLRNDMMIQRRVKALERRADRINQIRLRRKLRG